MFDRTVGVDPEPQEDDLFLLKSLVVVVCSGETLALPSSVLVLVRCQCRFVSFTWNRSVLYSL